MNHAALVSDLRARGIDESYVSLLRLLYQNQYGQVNDSLQFRIERDVKQGHVLSAILFNYVIDIAFESWPRRLNHHGLYVAHGLPRLTNTRYVDDISFSGKLLDELIGMEEALIEELRAVGLDLNASKSKILHSEVDDIENELDFCEIAGEFVRVLHGHGFHKYLGRHGALSREHRLDQEFSHRKQQA